MRACTLDVSDPKSPRFIGAVRMTRDSSTSRRTIARRPRRASSASRREIGTSSWATGIRSIPTACSPSAWHRASAFPKLPGWSTSARTGVGASRTISFPKTNQGTAPLTVFSSRVIGAAFAVTPERTADSAGAKNCSPLADLSTNQHGARGGSAGKSSGTTRRLRSAPRFSSAISRESASGCPYPRRLECCSTGARGLRLTPRGRSCS